MFEKILDLVNQFETVIIHRHNKPDGDAVGSQTGLYFLLTENFPDKNIYTVGDGAGNYSFMERSATDTVPNEAYENALAIILDCGAASLISDDRYKTAKMTARIDHHMFAETIADTEVIDTSFESCCGMIAEFARESKLTLSFRAAKAIFTGMVTDSGRFRYDSTSARTFELASYLMSAGFDTNDIYRELYADTYESRALRAKFTLKMNFTENNVAYIYTDKDELSSLGVDTFTVSRGMVGTMADIKGVTIWVNFTETDSGVLCEIRSSLYNINPVAVKYGGGGHAKASGATVPDRNTAMSMLADLDKMAKAKGDLNVL